ncbi:MAG: hypothetical protein M3O34_15235 [Chloroflexota bacterium]|nr:hypothetical protein [Chloroflexota bacterium]
MGRKFPVAPTIGTAVCVAAVNVLLAYFLAQAIFGGIALTFGPIVIVALILIAVAAGAYAAHGWRRYLRPRG